MGGLGISIIIGTLISLVIIHSDTFPPLEFKDDIVMPDIDKEKPINFTIKITKSEAFDIYEVVETCRKTQCRAFIKLASYLEDAFKSKTITSFDMEILEKIHDLATDHFALSCYVYGIGRNLMKNYNLACEGGVWSQNVGEEIKV